MTKTRGQIAPLKQSAARLAGLTVYRDGVFLGGHDDPCEWPTASIVDCHELSPDRTHSGPLKDDAWEKLINQIRRTSKRALANQFKAPEDALTNRSVNARLGVLELRGRVWLGARTEASGIRFAVASGTGLVAPSVTVAGIDHVLPIGGALISFPVAVAAAGPLAAPRDLLIELYQRLLVQARRRWRVADKDQIAAHVAFGIATGQLLTAISDTTRSPLVQVRGVVLELAGDRDDIRRLSDELHGGNACEAELFALTSHCLAVLAGLWATEERARLRLLKRARQGA